MGVGCDTLGNQMFHTIDTSVGRQSQTVIKSNDHGDVLNFEWEGMTINRILYCLSTEKCLQRQ